MPSRSMKQAKLMRAAAHNKSIADDAGVPQSVAREFVDADKRRAARKAKRKKGKR